MDEPYDREQVCEQLVDLVPPEQLPVLLAKLLRRMMQLDQVDHIPGISFASGPDGFTSDAAASFQMAFRPASVTYDDGPAGG